jgi:WD40 repeat protein
MEGMGHICFSPDGSEAVTAGRDIIVWDTATWKQKTRLSPGFRASYSADGLQLVANSSRDRLEIWDTQTWRRIARLDSYSSHSEIDASFSPDGRNLVVANTTKLFIWDIQRQETLYEIEPEGTITPLYYSPTYSPDGTYIAAANRAEVGVWEADTGRRIVVLERAEDRDVQRLRLLYSPDGRYLAATGTDQATEIWDTHTWARSLVLRPFSVGRDSIMYGPAYSPDGRRIITTHFDAGVAKIWNVATGEVAADLLHPGVQSAAYTPDGRHIVSVSWTTMIIWDTALVEKGGEFLAR